MVAFECLEQVAVAAALVTAPPTASPAASAT